MEMNSSLKIEIGAHQGGFDPGQDLGRQRLAALLFLAERGAGIGMDPRLGRLLLLLGDQALDIGQDVAVLGLDVVPAGKDLGIGLFRHQGIVAEQITHPLDGGLDLRLGDVLVDEQQVGGLEDEELAVEVLDQSLKIVGGDPNVMVAAVDRAQARQVDLHRLAALLAGLQPADVVEQQVLLADPPPRAIGWARHQTIPLAAMRSTSRSTKWP